MNACQTFDDTLKFFTELDKLSLKQRQQFESNVPEDSWTWLLNLPSKQEQEQELEPALLESEQQSKSEQQPTLEEFKALLLARDSLVQLRELKRKHSKTIAIAYDFMSAEEQAHVDALAALAVPHRVFKYLGNTIVQGSSRLVKGALVYIDPATQLRANAYSAEVWTINGVSSGWQRSVNVSLSLLKEVTKAVLPNQEHDGAQQMGLI